MKTTNEKIAQLRKAMMDAGCEAYLIPTGDPHASEYLPLHFNAREYFSGFSGENSVLVVTSKKSALWADGRYFVQAEKQLAGSEIELERMGEPGVPTSEQYCADALGKGQHLGLCGLTASTSMVRKLEEAIGKKGADVRTLNLEDELWVEGRPELPATRAWILGKEYTGFSPAEKLEQLRGKLAEENCTAQMVGKLDTLAWLLNLRAMDITCTPYAMAYCYVTPKDAVLFINIARLDADAAAELKNNGVTIREYGEVLSYLKGVTEKQTVLADTNSVNYAVYSVLKENAALTVKDGTDPLILMKGVKNDVELAHIREAHLRDAVAMIRSQMEVEKRMKSGEKLHETDVSDVLLKYRSQQDKFLCESFGTIAAWGPNAAMMHYQPTRDNQSEIQRRGFLLVDSGATYLDGSTDITRTYTVGPLTEDEKKFYTWTLQSHIDIAKAVWLDYCTGEVLDAIAREPLWRHLINYRCGTGHSVSFVGNVHEGPQGLGPRCSAAKFVPGMTVTDEPGVYEADEVGVRIENELECVENCTNQYGRFLEFKPITWVPIDTTPVIPSLLDHDELEWLNNYHKNVYEKISPLLTADERKWLAGKCAAIG